METVCNTMSLCCKIITSVRTYLGYLQVLEYVLQDGSSLHVVQWHFDSTIDKDTLVPIQNNQTFYQDKDAALKLAYNVGKLLLQQYGYEKKGQNESLAE